MAKIESEAIEPQPTSSLITISTGANVVELVRRAGIIDEIFKKIMKRDVHYGVIPGTGSDKPSLYKAGAEKLMAVFNLGPKLEIEKTLLPDGHREYQVTAHIYHYPTGKLIGDGVAVCSTMESKYRYRNVSDFEITGEVIPRDYKERKTEYRKQGFGAKKVEGEWQWVKFGDSEKSENPDIADQFNTAIKMAKKRALVDGVLTATGASDIFTQDIEDYADMGSKAPLDTTPAKKDVDAPTRKAVIEEVEVWEEEVRDVEESATSDGGLVYLVKFQSDRWAGTRDKTLAEDAAATEGLRKFEVVKGRKPGSHVLKRIQPEG